MKSINTSVRVSTLDRLGAHVKPKTLAAFKRIERRQVRARERQFMIKHELPMAVELMADQIQISSNLHAKFARKMKRKVNQMVTAQIESKNSAWLAKHLVTQDICISYMERGHHIFEKRIQSVAYCG